jgi:FkbM family methyltransferase
LFGIKLISRSIIDPNGNGMLSLMMANAQVPNKYKFMFYEMVTGSIFIDGGMNEGIITDICLKFGAKIYGFEPNPFAAKFLKNKYRNNENVIVEPKAISNRDGKISFNFSDIFDQGGTKCDVMNKYKRQQNKFEVEEILFSNYVKSIVKQEQKDIYMCKLDIEGAEFEVLEDIIESGVYKNIKYIVCETHARFFGDGDERLKKIEKMITDKNITNIYLDWI